MTIVRASASPSVLSVHVGDGHAFGKAPRDAIRLVENWGVEGDAHAGLADQHLYHIRRFGRTPNLRQVHLIQSETLAEVGAKGFAVQPGALGENISTRNVDLLSLPTGTRLALGSEAVIELTGLRSPCAQIDKFQAGLLAQFVDRSATGVRYTCGVMSIVIKGGEVRSDDIISIALPSGPHSPLIYVKPTSA